MTSNLSDPTSVFQPRPRPGQPAIAGADLASELQVTAPTTAEIAR